jgi:hypothetical protein
MSDDRDGAFTEEISEPSPEGSGVTIEDFVAYMPGHTYIFTPCREIWPGASVNARLGRMPALSKTGKPRHDRNGNPLTIPASTWLDRNRPVEQMTWVPGLPMLIPGRLVVDGGWVDRNDVTCFNLYRPPRLKLGDAGKAERWVNHVHKIYPIDAGHIIKWLAHRVQKPAEKINHALVLGGAQGIGKDTLLEPMKHAVGPWNFHEVSPTHLLGRFNSFVKSVILRVNEARDLGELDRFKFYDHTKVYTAAPPDVLRVDEKNLREHYVFNCLGFIITTNHRTDGIFLPADDRRHYVAWSSCIKEAFGREYWNGLWRWYLHESGFSHVGAYLSKLDISYFDPKAPPLKTEAFWDIVTASSSPEDAELADILDKLGNPHAVTPRRLVAGTTGAASEWLTDRKYRRAIPHRLERCGYTSIRNPNADDGYWVIDAVRQPVYVRSELSEREKLQAATALAKPRT